MSSSADSQLQKALFCGTKKCYNKCIVNYASEVKGSYQKIEKKYQTIFLDYFHHLVDSLWEHLVRIEYQHSANKHVGLHTDRANTNSIADEDSGCPFANIGSWHVISAG